MKEDVAENKTIVLSHADRQGLTPPDDAQQNIRRVQTRIFKPLTAGRKRKRAARPLGAALRRDATATGRPTLPISGRAVPHQPVDRR